MSEHIKVELDFIPVEERLPEERGYYPVLLEERCGIHNRIDESFWNGDRWGLWPAKVTHYAEIPEAT